MLKLLYQKMSRIVPMDFTKVLLLDIDVSDKDAAFKKQDSNQVQLRVLSEEALMHYIDKPTYELSYGVAESASDQHVMCVGAYIKDKLAAYVFFCSSPVDAQRNSGGPKFTGIQLTFPANVRYLYKMLVLPEFRGRQLAGKMIQFAAQDFIENGISYVVTTTDWTNAAFLKSTKSVGFESKGIAGEMVIFGSRRYFLPGAITIKPYNAQPIELSKPSAMD